MPRILLIEDDAALRRTLRTILEKALHTVAEAGDGLQGVALFSKETFDLVITDIIMPNREGIETIGDIRRLDPHVPIVAISGGGSVGGELFLKLAEQVGATRTLAKPIRPVDLVQAVASCLGASSTEGPP